VKARAVLRIKGTRNNVLSATAKAIEQAKTFHAVFVEERGLLLRKILRKTNSRRFYKND